MKRFAGLILTILFAIVLLPGCATKLSPTGVYKEDAFLYQVDQTINLQYAALKAFTHWENGNRAEITNRWPQVTILADKVRKDAPGWFAIEGIFRGDYVQAKAVFDAAGGTGTNTLAAAKARLTDNVNLVASHVGDAQVAVDSTTLVNRPVLIPPPAK